MGNKSKTNGVKLTTTTEAGKKINGWKTRRKVAQVPTHEEVVRAHRLAQRREKTPKPVKSLGVVIYDSASRPPAIAIRKKSPLSRRRRIALARLSKEV